MNSPIHYLLITRLGNELGTKLSNEMDEITYRKGRISFSHVRDFIYENVDDAHDDFQYGDNVGLPETFLSI